jgi:V8-like Glu-specific endopeptidase
MKTRSALLSTLLLASCTAASDPPAGPPVRLVGPAKFSDSAVEVQESALTFAARRDAIIRQPALRSMRALALHAGQVYETVDPVDLTAVARDTGSSLRPDGQLGTSQQAVGIIGTDQRWRNMATSAFPYNTAVRVGYQDGGACSAIMIGPHTAVTAAHCFYNTKTNTWFASRFFAAGAETINNAPFYPFSTWWTWTIWIPGGYHTDGDYDMALIDFGSPSSSGVQWLGTHIPGPTEYTDEGGATIERSGYDQDKQGPTGPHDSDLRPQQWTSWGALYPACYAYDGSPYPDCQIFIFDADITAGGSGSGVFFYTTGSYQFKLAGVAIFGYQGPFNINYNAAQTWRQWSYNFVHSLDSHWP